MPVYCSFPFITNNITVQVSVEKGELIKLDPDPPACFNQLFPVEVGEARFFTDGSKSGNLPFAGFAVIDEYNKVTLRYRTSCKVSIFLCKAMAIISALKIASDCPAVKVSIFSDSKSVLQTLLLSKKNRRNTSNLIFMILALLYNMSQNGKFVRLVWTPAHLNIDGNERADCVAKEAIFVGRDAEFLLPPSDLSAF